MSMSPLGTIVATVLLLAFVVWGFWRAGGSAPSDAKRHKAVRKSRRHLFRGIPR